MFWAIVQCLFGLVLLWLASEMLVEFSASLGRRLRVSSFVVGIVIVGFGTSVPELTISSLSAAQGDLDLAVGNIVGSNTANLSLALGLSAIVTPRLEIPGRGIKRLSIIAVVSVGIFALLEQGHFYRWEGAILLSLVIPVLWILYQMEKRAVPPGETQKQLQVHESHLYVTETPKAERSLWKILLGVFAGLIGTVAGAQVLVWGTKDLADVLSVETGFLGLTLVALGTSAPEIIVGIRSAIKRETGILAGNLLGSNISNSFIVGGFSALLGPATVMDSSLTGLATFIMVGVSILGGIIMMTGKGVGRIEAVILIGAWAAMLPLVA